VNVSVPAELNEPVVPVRIALLINGRGSEPAKPVSEASVGTVVAQIKELPGVIKFPN
jgi:hypothetical protein